MSRRRALEGAVERSIAPPSPWKAAVLVVRDGGRGVVVKDVSRTNALYRPLGRFLLRREAALLRLLAGTSGVPPFLGWVDRDAFAVGRLLGEPLSYESVALAPEAFFDRLLGLVREIHARGVAHLDLRQKRNVLVALDGWPVVVDFGAAVRLPRSPLLAPLARLLRRVDESAVLKFRLRYRRLGTSEAERARHRRFERLRRLWIFRPARRRRPPRDARQGLDGGSPQA